MTRESGEKILWISFLMSSDRAENNSFVIGGVSAFDVVQPLLQVEAKIDRIIFHIFPLR